MSGTGAVGPGQPVPLYDSATAQRDRTVTGFDAQREAILKAVDAQRQAAMAPMRPVQPRQAQSSAAPHAMPVVPPGVSPAATQAISRQQAVATDIVLTLKAMVAEEVRAQLIALLAAADQRQKTPPPEPTNPSLHG